MIPILTNTEQAIVGTGQAVLSAADRDVIKRRVGETDPSLNFAAHVKNLFTRTRIIDEVETGEKQQVEQEDFDTRIKLQRNLIKHAPHNRMPEERVEISIETVDPATIDKTEKKEEKIPDDHIDKLEHALNTGIVDQLKNQDNPELVEWLHSIISLKQLHLKRVLCNSKKEFESLSQEIVEHTGVARKLGLKISRRGVSFVEAKLETMATDAANYKLELLRSMQKMSFDKNREKDINWLSDVISRLKRA